MIDTDYAQIVAHAIENARADYELWAHRAWLDKQAKRPYARAAEQARRALWLQQTFEAKQEQH